jgi:hypothetical protein
MTSSPAAAARLARLQAELSPDIQALEARAAELRGLLEGWQQATMDAASLRTTVIVAAVNVHGWYTAMETAFERIARLLDETTPSGPARHAELVSQMAVAVPGLRPALLDTSVPIELAEVRKFRHFFRNAYVLNFDASRMYEQAERVLRLHEPVRAGLARLAAHVSTVLSALADG